MALLGNYSVLNKTCGKHITGSTTAGANQAFDRGNYNKSGANRNFYAGWMSVSNVTNKASIPNGSSKGYSWVLPIKAGGIALSYGAGGTGRVTGNIAGGYGLGSTLSGSGSFSTVTLSALGILLSTLNGSSSVNANIVGSLNAFSTLTGQGNFVGAITALSDLNASLIGESNITGNLNAGINISSTLSGDSLLSGDVLALVNLVATTIGTSTFTADVTGGVDLSSTLNGSSSLTSTLTAIADLVSTIIGTGTLTNTLSATANLDCTITPYTELSPESLAASVWNALAASYNAVGSMGEKMNDAGSASNPWTEIIEGGYTAAECLRLLTAVAAGKTTIVDLGGGQATVTFRDINDTVDRIEADMTGSERTNVTKNL